MTDKLYQNYETIYLRWPSQIFNEDGEPCQIQKLVGYRIYVNGYPKGMIKPHKNRALGTVTSIECRLELSNMIGQ